MATSETTKTEVNKIPEDDKRPVQPPVFFGRTVIKLDADEVTDDNLITLLNNALTDHSKNSFEINYLWNYYKGKQPILGKEKDYREDINNIVCVNRAMEIMSFWTGFLYPEPIKYVPRKGSEGVSAAIEAINDMMSAENKERKDFELITWMLVCGTAYRYLMAKPSNQNSGYADAPFGLDSLDPRTTFVAYSNRIGHKQLFSCTYWNDEEQNPVYGIYTDEFYYEVSGGLTIKKVPHYHGRNPIVEYPANFARLGVFEPVLSLINAGNQIESDRMDALEQYVQGFLKFINCDLEDGQLEEFLKKGAIMVSSHEGKTADVDFVTTNLSQSDTQVQSENIYDMILTICGMPNRNGGSSTSDTGLATIYRDGWAAADSRALAIENMFKGAEIETLKLLIKIIREKNIEGYDEETQAAFRELSLKDIDVHFGRRSYSNAYSKVQILTQMLAEPKIHPRYAFEACGLFIDPENAYVQSEKYYAELLNETDPTRPTREDDMTEDDDDVQTGG